MFVRSFMRLTSKSGDSAFGKFHETEYRKVRIQWKKRNICFEIFDVSPCNKKNVEMLEVKNMNIIKYIKKAKLDMVIFGIGYIDYHKILKTFNRAHLIKNKNIDAVHLHLRKANGQYTSLIQQCLLLNIPHFCLGRDRLTELASIGSAIFSSPKEILFILYYFLVNSASKEKNTSHENNVSLNKNDIMEDSNISNLAPNFYKALIVENALYLAYNIHAKLLQITKSEFYIPATKVEAHEKKVNTEANNTKESIREKIKLFFEETAHDQIHSLRNKILQSELYYNFFIPDEKKDINILIICDTICVDYLFQYIQKNFAALYNVPPFYKELFTFEKKNSYKYSLSLFLFVFAPFAWALTLLIKYIYYLWVEYFTKGKVITVGGDMFFRDSKLIDFDEDRNLSVEDNHFEETIKKKKKDYETVSLMGGLLQWFKDKSRN